MALTQAQIRQILIDGFGNISGTNIDPELGYDVIAEAIFDAITDSDNDLPDTFVESFNTRTGDVVPESGDYNTELVTESGANLYFNQTRFDQSFMGKSTDDLSEGNLNFYFTDTRFDTAFSGKTTTDLTEGTNFYYTSTRFNTDFSNQNTDNLSEGSVNLYYTESRFDTSFSGKTTTDLSEGTNFYYTQARFDSAFGAKTTDDLTQGTSNLYFPEAPQDGNSYVRRNATWQQISSVGDITAAAVSFDDSSLPQSIQDLNLENVQQALAYLLNQSVNTFIVNPGT